MPESIDMMIAREYVSQCACPMSPIAVAVEVAYRAGREWKWRKAEYALNRAYELAGGKNPGSGYDWHAGAHPLHAAIQRAEREIGVDDI